MLKDKSNLILAALVAACVATPHFAEANDKSQMTQPIKEGKITTKHLEWDQNAYARLSSLATSKSKRYTERGLTTVTHGWPVAYSMDDTSVYQFINVTMAQFESIATTVPEQCKSVKEGSIQTVKCVFKS